jgi:hypothetical protein
MSKTTDQSTRLLCASVLLGHGGARAKVIEWFRDHNRGVADELGVNLKLAIQLARWAARRERRYVRAYFLIFVLTAVAALAEVAGGGVGLASAILGSVITGIVWIRKRAQERNEFAKYFLPAKFNAEEVAGRFKIELKAHDITALPSSNQNFFAYGGFTPFVGAGYDLGGWSVAIATDKAKEVLGRSVSIEKFEAADVYRAIDEDVQRLALTGIETNDCYYASGADLRYNRKLLPDIYGRPAQYLDAAAAAPYLYADDDAVRHYRCYRIPDWGGELAYSYYLRCSLRGNTLFVETRKFLVTPLDQAFRTIDDTVALAGKEWVATVIAGILAGPFLLLAAPFRAYGAVMHWFQEFADHDKERRRMIDEHPRFNYGTASSLRQALSGSYQHYFQKVDSDFFGKALERQILDALVAFLERRGIDTSELRERQTTIMNSGVIVQGGDVNAEALAVGAGSRAAKKVRTALRATAASAGATGGTSK